MKCGTSVMGRIFGHRWYVRTWSITGGSSKNYFDPPMCFRCGWQPPKRGKS